MKDLGKINTRQLYVLWQNESMSLLMLMLAVFISNFLPYYLSPIITLGLAAFLYYFIYHVRLKSKNACVLPLITALYAIVLYSFLTIILNILHIWGFLNLPKEFVFFTEPFIPSLILNPMLLIVSAITCFRRQGLKICVECRMHRTGGGSRSATGVVVREFHLQLRNLFWISLILTAIVWVYYQWIYIDVNINARDTYIFTWLTLIGLMLDEIYFIYRYYNLYLDMKESNELISQEELNYLGVRTFIRYYVVKDNKIYLSPKMHDPNIPGREVIDTPFFLKQNVNGLHISEVKRLIEEKTGINDGELRFFFGQKNDGDSKYTILRYFYFLNDDSEEFPELETEGQWVDFDKVKYLYSTRASELAELAVHDITRLATIILTEKIFDENGNRKLKLKSYNPTFNLIDVRKSHLDFQDNKWIEISMFNSDTPLFRLKKWFNKRKVKSSRK